MGSKAWLSAIGRVSTQQQWHPDSTCWEEQPFYDIEPMNNSHLCRYGHLLYSWTHWERSGITRKDADLCSPITSPFPTVTEGLLCSESPLMSSHTGHKYSPTLGPGCEVHPYNSLPFILVTSPPISFLLSLWPSSWAIQHYSQMTADTFLRCCLPIKGTIVGTAWGLDYWKNNLHTAPSVHF